MTAKPTQCAQGYDCDACKGIEGMTLRDWFAGMAMQGILASPDCSPKNDIVVAATYKLADAMLKEREK